MISLINVASYNFDKLNHLYKNLYKLLQSYNYLSCIYKFETDLQFASKILFLNIITYPIYLLSYIFVKTLSKLFMYF